MPHVIIKIWPGRTMEQKKAMTDRIVEDMIGTLGVSEKSISVAFEEINPDEWIKKVYKPDIEEQYELLTKKPGYTP